MTSVPEAPVAGLLEPRVAATPEWEAWDDQRLLDTRLCDLGLRLRGSFVDPFLRQVRLELRQHGLQFRPHFWLSDEWFTPDGVPASRSRSTWRIRAWRGSRRAQMLEVEGGTPEWCLRILRHEAGHAIDNAYRLRRRRAAPGCSAGSSEPYPEYYTPRPYSKSFVLHLDPWYAQSHPDEDFAETFAVWLTPNSSGAQRYAGWPALRSSSTWTR